MLQAPEPVYLPMFRWSALRKPEARLNNHRILSQCRHRMLRHVLGVFVYRNIADLEAIIGYSQRPDVKSATVVGGGVSF